MPRRIPFEENAYYHVYNRGFQKQSIFFSDKDFERFLRYINHNLVKYKEEIWLIAYCLLPNHFHFVLQSKKEGFAISNFIAVVTMSYIKYIKTKYALDLQGKNFFEARFQSKKLDSDAYLHACIQYVELNALKHGLVENPDQRSFSSRDQTKSLNREILDLDREF